MVKGVPQVKVAILVPSNVMPYIVVYSLASLKTASQVMVLIFNVVMKFLLNDCGKFRFKLYLGSHGTWINMCKCCCCLMADLGFIPLSSGIPIQLW